MGITVPTGWHPAPQVGQQVDGEPQGADPGPERMTSGWDVLSVTLSRNSVSRLAGLETDLGDIEVGMGRVRAQEGPSSLGKDQGRSRPSVTALPCFPGLGAV